MTNEVYQKRLARMKKFELLEEISKFQNTKEDILELSLPQLVQGKLLFAFLAQHAVSFELRQASFMHQKYYERALEARLDTPAFSHT